MVGFLNRVTGTYHVLNCKRIIPATHVSQIMTDRKLQKRCHGYEDQLYDKNNWFYRKFVLKRYWHEFTWSLSLVNLWLHVLQWSRRSSSTSNIKTNKEVNPLKLVDILFLEYLMAPSRLLRLSCTIIINSRHGLQIKRLWSIIQVLSCTSITVSWIS